MSVVCLVSTFSFTWPAVAAVSTEIEALKTQIVVDTQTLNSSRKLAYIENVHTHVVLIGNLRKSNTNIKPCVFQIDMRWKHQSQPCIIPTMYY